MKLLHLCAYFQTSQLYCQLFEHLDAEGTLQQCVFSVVQRSAYRSENTVLEGYEVTVKGTLSIWHRLFFRLKIHSIVKQLFSSGILNEKPALMHAHTLFSDGAVAYKVHKRLGVPYVVAVRNTDLNVFLKYKPYLKPLAARILSTSQAVVCISPAMKSSLVDMFPSLGLERKIRIIPNGIESFWMENAARAGRDRFVCSHGFRAVYVGRINRNKNLVNLVLAMKRLRETGVDIQLAIYGDKEWNDTTLNRALAESFVTVHGYVARRNDLLNEYRQADIFVMPSFTETFGLVYAEAMSQGLPVMYSKAQGFDGWFTDGQCGVAVDPHNVESIAEGLQTMIQCHMEMSREAVKNYSIFNWPDVARKYRTIYKSITGA